MVVVGSGGGIYWNNTSTQYVDGILVCRSYWVPEFNKSLVVGGVSGGVGSSYLCVWPFWLKSKMATRALPTNFLSLPPTPLWGGPPFVSPWGLGGGRASCGRCTATPPLFLGLLG